MMNVANLKKNKCTPWCYLNRSLGINWCSRVLAPGGCLLFVLIGSLPLVLKLLTKLLHFRLQ